jgi:hypothetical protein
MVACFIYLWILEAVDFWIEEMINQINLIINLLFNQINH